MKFNFKTFSFNTVSFGDTTIAIQDYAKEFTVLIDLNPKKEILVQVHGLLDTLTGVVTWEFHSLDRVTKELVEDPDLGFLPPNISSPEGEGNVSFSCLLNKTIAHDEIVSNKASIIFDLNTPIVTNTYKNRIDAVTPTSTINALNAKQIDTTFTVSWNGLDEGSGIKKYNIFVAQETSPFVLWKIASKENSASFTGENGKTYSFYSIVSDSLGLTEGTKNVPDATTKVELTGIAIGENDIMGFQITPNPASAHCVISFEMKEAGNRSITIENSNGKTVQVIKSNALLSGKTEIPIDLEL